MSPWVGAAAYGLGGMHARLLVASEAAVMGAQLAGEG